jgi:hypothetical protein
MRTARTDYVTDNTGRLKPTRDDARYQGTISIHYPFHPLYRQKNLSVVRRGVWGVELVELQFGSKRRAVPVWMTDPLRCSQMTCGLQPTCSLTTLLRLGEWLQIVDL